MAKLYFKYGVMGSSKTAQALMSKFNFEEKGKKVWLIKPAIDNRDGEDIIKSRIGLEQKATVIGKEDSILEKFSEKDTDVIICDEAQFFSEEQIDELRGISVDSDIPVVCFGLRTDFANKLFPGSKRLFELADTFEEIKSMCRCGKKATVNARLDSEGHIVTEGDQVVIGGNEQYVGMCWACKQKAIEKDKAVKRFKMARTAKPFIPQNEETKKAE